MINIGGVRLPNCTELRVDTGGSSVRPGRLEMQRATADCILSGGEMTTAFAALHTCCFASWTVQLPTPIDDPLDHQHLMDFLP